MQGSQAECALNYLNVRGTTIKAALPDFLYLIQLILNPIVDSTWGRRCLAPMYSYKCQENMNIKEKYKQKDPERQAFIKMEDLSGRL